MKKITGYRLIRQVVEKRREEAGMHGASEGGSEA
jgi:hypothetical protein